MVLTSPPETQRSSLSPTTMSALIPQAESFQRMLEQGFGSPPLLPVSDVAETVNHKRKISLFNVIIMIVGSIIGSSIFVSPKTQLSPWIIPMTPLPMGVLEIAGSVWLSRIIFIVIGSFCCVELGATIMKSGVDYACIHKAFGPMFSYLSQKSGSGVFLVPFTLMLVIIAIPIYCWARFRRRAVSVWSYLKDMTREKVGCMMAVCYIMINLWILLYLVQSFFSLLPLSTNLKASTGNSTAVAAECKLSYQYDPKVWIEEATRVILSLVLTFGGFLAVQSYMSMLNNDYRNPVIVYVINCGSSVFAGAVVLLIVCLVLVGLLLCGSVDGNNF